MEHLYKYHELPALGVRGALREGPGVRMQRGVLYGGIHGAGTSPSGRTLLLRTPRFRLLV